MDVIAVSCLRGLNVDFAQALVRALRHSGHRATWVESPLRRHGDLLQVHQPHTCTHSHSQGPHGQMHDHCTHAVPRPNGITTVRALRGWRP